MANIKIEVDYQIEDGISLVFKAPCECTAVTGIKVYYPVISESGVSSESKTFVFRDAHGNLLTGLGNLFATGAMVKVVLDVTNGAAYIQNADTNKYLEGKINAAMPVSGGDFTGVVTAAATDSTAAMMRNVIVVDAGTDVNSLTVPAGTIVMVRK